MSRRGCFLAASLLLFASFAPARAADENPEVGGKTLKQWLQELKSLDPYVNETAIRAIVQFGKEAREATPLLIAKVNDADVGVAANAILALRTIGVENKEMPALVAALTSALQKGSAVSRMQSALALAQIGPDARGAVRPLVDMVQYPNRIVSSWEIRKAAALALGRVGQDANKVPDTNAVRALQNALKDPCAQVRLQAILSIGMLQAHLSPVDMGIRQALETLRNEKDQAVLIWARVLLAQMESMRPEVHLAYLTGQLQNNREAPNRAHAAQALGALRVLAKDKIPELTAALKDADPLVAGAAVIALGQMKEPIADKQVTAIARLLNDADVQTKCHACQALGLLGGKAKEHIPQLIGVLKDKEAAAAGAAAEALGQMKDNVADVEVPAVARLLSDPQVHTRCQAAQLLGAFGPKAKASVPDLIKALQDKETQVVGCAVVALAQLGKDAGPALPALNELKQHKDEAVKAAAAKAVEEISGKMKK